MARGELVAWQAGIDWHRAGLTFQQWQAERDGDRTQLLSDDAQVAYIELDRITFDHWFRRGVNDAETAGRA